MKVNTKNLFKNFKTYLKLNLFKKNVLVTGAYGGVGAGGEKDFSDIGIAEATGDMEGGHSPRGQGIDVLQCGWEIGLYRVGCNECGGGGGRERKGERG